MSTESAESLFKTGLRLLPTFRDDDEDPAVIQRGIEAGNLIRRAAEMGHFPALEALASGMANASQKEQFERAVECAKLGEDRHLISILTSGDYEQTADLLSVLEQARAGAPWAQLVLGSIYGMGMVDNETGEPTATRDM